MAIRIEVSSKRAVDSARFVQQARRLGIDAVQSCRTSQLYFLAEHPGTEQLSRLCAFLLADPVTEAAQWFDLSAGEVPPVATHVVEVALRPGVTDVTARELERGMAELGIPVSGATTATRYELTGDLSEGDLHRLAQGLLCNGTIEHYTLGRIPPQFEQESAASDFVEEISLTGLDEASLLALSGERMLSLDGAEMKAIQDYFDELERSPTDVELETLAQTWSEHCVHKTFRSKIIFRWWSVDGHTRALREIPGLLKYYLRRATETVNRAWLRSAFVDNAGIIAFDDDFDLAFKVETHNHPSALEPYGGANTGIGGVVRDIIGVSARPIACTDVLCFAPQDFPQNELPAGLLHPARIREGVVAGIGDYGNKLGLPTVNGAVVYDAGYLGNPLVFAGCVGLLPRHSHPTAPQLGDRVVVLGGRTGRDGLHGATFSSAELTHETSESAGSAVQIGDPITEKGLIELIEAARDARLYTAITDCGAGGLSSACGEMGKELGVEVELSEVALKYPGLTPWEIWLSEAQERMVLAVPQENLPRLQELADSWDVEVRVLGLFTGDGALHVTYQGRPVAHLGMKFLHDGWPARQMQAEYRDRRPEIGDWRLEIRRLAADPQSPISNLSNLLLRLLSHPSVASKEAIVRTYDHEVRGGTLVRPFTGPQMDGPSDAAVLKPLGTWQHNRAFSLSVGINPLLGKRDPYAMAVSAIDEAFRNAVAVGADPDQIALLDNFCWGNPKLPDRLGSLVRAAQGCYDGSLAYNAPFISGKDSLYNEFNGQPIPGTLLISAIGIVPDIHHTCTSDLKAAGNRLYLIGESAPELGGSLLFHLLGIDSGDPPKMPQEPLARYTALHRAIQAGLVQSCHDLSEGGLAVALAEMCIGGRLGLQVEGGKVQVAGGDLSAVEVLFGESNGRLLVEVRPEDASALEALFAGLPLSEIGAVSTEGRLVVELEEGSVLDLAVEQLVSAWKGL
ncbi:MAG: phosphoribosylformylglycinamidine synthase subunit PurL [Chloroflexi bacterium]|nr:MAG: phosphoribosylformylglycinamidine synthase subunit PurL [Chloroflexota bacterium]